MSKFHLQQEFKDLIGHEPQLSGAVVSILELAKENKGGIGPSFSLTQNEGKLLSRHRSEKRRIEWLAGRLAAKEAVMNHLHTKGIDTPEILSHSTGAPYVANFDGLFVSLSHSQAFAVSVAAPFPVGIDLEKIEPRAQSFIELWYGNKEQHHFNTLNEKTRLFEVNRAWTYKEAIVKTLGQGGSIALKSICSRSPQVTIQKKSHTFDTLSMTSAGYALTVAYLKKAITVHG